MSKPQPVAFGDFKDKRKGKLLFLLETANVNLADSRMLIHGVFDPEQADKLARRVYFLQQAIRTIKTQVKE